MQHSYVRILCLASMAGALAAQTTDRLANFQYFSSVTSPVRFDVMPDQAVSSKPFSGSEERHTLQVLADGTRIEKTDTNRYFRDNDGRTRIEHENGIVVISDPVEGFTAELNTEQKTARKAIVRLRTGGQPGPIAIQRMRIDDAPLPPLPPPVPTAPGAPAVMTADAGVRLRKDLPSFTIATAGPVSAGIVGYAAGDLHPLPVVYAQSASFASTIEAGGKGPDSEDLGTQVINGVPAHGTRTTIVIPAGQIGNDRDIRIVSERWFSNELQMLIKSSNNDPRFGENTYALTNILQGAQDPALFEIPAGFTVNGGMK